MAVSYLAVPLSSSSSSCSSYAIPKYKTLTSSSSSSSFEALKFRLPFSVSFHLRKLSLSALSLPFAAKQQNIRVSPSDFEVMDKEAIDGERMDEEEIDGDDVASGGKPVRKERRPCELYVCNLPRSYDIPQLLEMFKAYGTVISVEVSRNSQTGESRGSGYVTMSSVNSAKIAIAALDGTEVGGREMRVRFSVEMNPGARRNPAVLSSTPKKILIYESPYKIYIGNLSWSTKPHDLRNHFSKFGNIASVRVLHDQKGGQNRVFGFLSYSNREERDAAVSLDGTEFQGRKIIVRDSIERNES